jgi:hypothetical protein
MDLTSEIFRKVFQYLDNKISVEDIEDWFVPHLYEFLTLPPCGASELAGVVELGLAEMSNGQCSEEDFRSLLKKYIREHDTITIDMRPPELVCASSSANTTQVMFPAIPSELHASLESI